MRRTVLPRQKFDFALHKLQRDPLGAESLGIEHVDLDYPNGAALPAAADGDRREIFSKTQIHSKNRNIASIGIERLDPLPGVALDVSRAQIRAIGDMRENRLPFSLKN